jgi:hypothetical protein
MIDRIHPDDVETIAFRVVELLEERSPVARPFLDAAGVAVLLGVSAEWARDHAGELGAVRLGDGPRAPLRFDAERVRDYLDAQRVAKPIQRPAPRRPGPRRGRTADVELLPLPKGAR